MRKIIISVSVLSVLAVTGWMASVGAIPGVAFDQRTHSAAGVRRCWERVDDELESLADRRMMRDVCRDFASKHEAMFGPLYFVRRK